MRNFYLLLFSFFYAVSAIAQIGTLDPSFGNQGIQILATPGAPADFTIRLAVLPTADGSFFTAFGSGTEVKIGRYLSNGNLDLSFGTAGFTQTLQHSTGSLTPFRMDIQGDSMLVVSGGIGTIRGDAYLARFSIKGVLDTNFGIKIFRTNLYDEITFMQVREDVIFLGRMESIPGYNRPWIELFGSRLGTITINDPWSASDGNNAGAAINPQPFTVALQGTKTIAAGEQYRLTSDPVTGQPGFNADYALFRFQENQQPDLNFGSEGRLLEAGNRFNNQYILATPANKILSVGATTVYPPQNSDFLLTRYNNDGSPDLSFGVQGRVTIDFGGMDEANFALLQGSQIIVGGYTTDLVSGNKKFALARLNENGTLDQSFGSGGKQITAINGINASIIRMQLAGSRLLAYDASGAIVAYTMEVQQSLKCPENKVVATDPGKCQATVNQIDPVITGNGAAVRYSLSGATTGSGTGTASGKVFQKGTTQVTYSLNGSNCTFTVQVNDQEKPLVTALKPSTEILWPANNKMVDVFLTYLVSDNCGATAVSISVSSNEHNGISQPADWEIVNAKHIRLKASRRGQGSGREYTITITATDAAGNKTQSQCKVTVPHDLSDLVKTVIAKNLHALALPNPSVAQFKIVIQSRSSLPIQVLILDGAGRVLETRRNIAPGTIEVGATYRPGVYYAEILQGTEKLLLKLIKLQ